MTILFIVKSRITKAEATVEQMLNKAADEWLYIVSSCPESFPDCLLFVLRTKAGILKN